MSANFDELVAGRVYVGSANDATLAIAKGLVEHVFDVRVNGRNEEVNYSYTHSPIHDGDETSTIKSGAMQLAKSYENGEVSDGSEFANVEPFDVLVVGGGPAGSAAAIYSARKGIRTGIVAERFGGQVNDTLSIENIIGTKATEGPAFVSNLEAHVLDYNVDVMKSQRAAKIEKKDFSI